jgi:peptide/nickel transport system ATP-binding protein
MIEDSATLGAETGNGAAASYAKRPESVLEVKDLSIFFQLGRSEAQITKKVSFSVRRGERVGIVGESGCGKSVTALALLGLLPPNISRTEGSVEIGGRNLLRLPERELEGIRGRQVGMIFQEPMSALDPVFTIGHQLRETVMAHNKVSRREARERSIEALASVGIPAPERRYDDYPQQLSGGMRQRVMIAIALACKPQLLIADEPTTALDVTVQAQIVELLIQLTERTGTALLLITHDLGVVAEGCERIVTMYAGEVVEDGPVDKILLHPRHPYTSGLLRSLPRMAKPKARLASIPGRVPLPGEMPPGCRFAPRCTFADDRCAVEQALAPAPGGTLARCCRSGELELQGALA